MPGGGGGRSFGCGFPAGRAEDILGRKHSWGRYGPFMRKEMRDQLLVEQGKTYRVVPGKTALFLQIQGQRKERNVLISLEVRPGNGLGL